MKTPSYTRHSRFSFVFTVTAFTCICAISGTYFGFSPEWIGLSTDLFTMISFATISSISIAAPITLWAWNLLNQNYETSRELVKLSHFDHLSGAMSRTYLDTFVNETPDMAGVILMIDVDHFKLINDTHGHIIGDYAISKIGGMIKFNIREEDSFYRFGGEEFIVFLSNTTQKTGHDIAVRICQNIAETPITHEGKEINVTVSIGAALKCKSTPFQRTLAQADKNLYHVKQTGRNNVNSTDTPRVN